MEEEKVIQVSVQLPAQAMQGFTDMVRQLRRLAAEFRGGDRGEENAAFDEERFLAMREAPAARSTQAEEGPGAKEPASAARQVQDQLPEAVRAGVPDIALEGGQTLDAAVAEASFSGEEAPKPEDRAGGREEPERPESREEVSAEAPEGGADIPAVRARADSLVEDPPRAEGDPKSAIPEAEAVWVQASEDRREAEAAAGEAFAGPRAPEGAGFRMSEGPADLQSRWSGVTEELAAAGPAPLTAEAVSQAFRRDGRRYDNGFPLY